MDVERKLFDFNAKGGFQGLSPIHISLLPINNVMVMHLIKSQEDINLHCMDNFGRKPKDLCTYSSPLFKIVRKLTTQKVQNKIPQIDPLFDYENEILE